ncbi:hypothetical protein [Sandarakinorhabdus sp. AAP62]|uniref:hypothetical protein n=1 Tax=Sandarakinorhabdus sp. AAP62 TaxID=1248916 RepID=UPI0005274765|nr:hypothetical protein [Sandarakinorhabdus sp. AAP62]
MWNDDNAFYDDGEWITWTDINAHLSQLERLELRARFPHINLNMLPYLRSLLDLAESYYDQTGRHLQVYGDIGELFGEVAHGLKLHRNYAEGSDGKIGNDFVEVKTITPFKNKSSVTINLERNFSKVLIVKINANFEISSKLIDRKSLPKTKGKLLRLDWDGFDHEATTSEWLEEI